MNLFFKFAVNKNFMKFNFFTTLLVVFFFYNYTTANNYWGPTGHRTIGQIAENHLTKKAKRNIEKLLKGESLAFVSTYADEIKSDRHYDSFYTWHYVNMPLDGDYATAEKKPKGDLVTGIEKCIAVLEDKNSTEADKLFYLKMLVHLIGDLHQPMHIGQAEDKGGNTIQVQWFGKGTNLHHVWDEDMINKWDMSYTELACNAEELSSAQVKALQEGSIIDWVADTHKLSKKAYNSVQVGEKLSYDYNYNYFTIVRQQLQKGGIRLAKVLNDIFG